MAKQEKKVRYHGDGSVVATNRKARFEYELIEKLEAGLALIGPEAKSIRRGKVSIAEAYGRLNNGEAWISNMSIEPYLDADPYGRLDTRRERKLLLHRRELERLENKLAIPGNALVPLRIYFKNGRAKMEIALARGKRAYDKRQTLKDRDQKRELDKVRKEWRVT